MPSSSSVHDKVLAGKVAVVTGAYGGIGLAIAQHLKAMGASVVQADISFAPTPREAEGMLAVRCDISDPASVQALAALTHARFGPCEVLVNNAAISASRTPLESLSLDVWDRIFAVNLRGALVCAQAFVPGMFERRSGSIVNVASIAAQVATRVGAYGPTKAAMRALTHQMAVEWGPRGIRANSVSPGMIRTPLSETFYQHEANLRNRVARIPARRVGRPEDIASVVGFLASDASAYMSGEDIVVDGGFLKAALTNLYSEAEQLTGSSGA